MKFIQLNKSYDYIYIYSHDFYLQYLQDTLSDTHAQYKIQK